jgi:hypothetical protein
VFLSSSKYIFINEKLKKKEFPSQYVIDFSRWVSEYTLQHAGFLYCVPFTLIGSLRAPVPVPTLPLWLQFFPYKSPRVEAG